MIGIIYLLYILALKSRGGTPNEWKGLETLKMKSTKVGSMVGKRFIPRTTQWLLNTKGYSFTLKLYILGYSMMWTSCDNLTFVRMWILFITRFRLHGQWDIHNVHDLEMWINSKCWSNSCEGLEQNEW